MRLCWRPRQVVDRPLGDDLAPLDAGPRPEVDEVVGGAHRVLVVLDDDHRIAQLGKAAEGDQQPVVVAGVQADRRLVEDVEHAHQPRADLAGQSDALRFAAGERRRRAVERQVVQADVDQEHQPGPDLLEQLLGDRPRDGVERHDALGLPVVGRPFGQSIEERATSPMGSPPSSTRRLAADGDGPGAGVEPRAPAIGAGHAPHEGLELGPDRAAGGARYLSSNSLATPAHFSACDQTLLLLFHRWTISRSPVP